MNKRNLICLALHDAVRHACACANAGISPLPDLPVIIDQVRCPGIGQPLDNRACWINIKNDVTHIVDHSSGFTTSVFEGRAVTNEDRTIFRRKDQESAARIQ